jgi:stearoyl-CoA desaturase (delta-9 desaturase)
VFGFAGVAVWALQMAWIPFWAAGVVNGLGHWWGYRNFEAPTPRPTCRRGAVWIGGESCTTTHHAFPSSAKFALRKFEFDIGWAAIRVLRERRPGQGACAWRPRSTCVPTSPCPTARTMKALLAIRFQAMTDYYRNVTLPALREPSCKLPRAARGLADGGRWLDDDKRARLQAWLAERPRMAQLAEFRAKLWRRCWTKRSQRRPGHAGQAAQAYGECTRAEATALNASHKPVKRFIRDGRMKGRTRQRPAARFGE